MKDLSPADFEALVGTQITIDNPHDDLEPHTLTITGVEELMKTDDERRNAFAVYFEGGAMIDSIGEQAMQGSFTIQGSVLDGQELFITINGFAQNSVEDYEYEAIFG